MSEDKLIIKVKSNRGEDGYKTFSIRIKDELLEKIDDISKQTKRSRNEVISILLEYATQKCEIQNKK